MVAPSAGVDEAVLAAGLHEEDLVGAEGVVAGPHPGEDDPVCHHALSDAVQRLEDGGLGDGFYEVAVCVHLEGVEDAIWGAGEQHERCLDFTAPQYPRILQGRAALHAVVQKQQVTARARLLERVEGVRVPALDVHLPASAVGIDGLVQESPHTGICCEDSCLNRFHDSPIPSPASHLENPSQGIS